MYFANDGGIYRVLNGYTGLNSGTCGGSNLFDSLNQTLGSMTQFVSFSQHPTDPNIILGGTQDNGSPATASSQNNTSWLNVNSGDGGFNEINPSNPNKTTPTTSGVSITVTVTGPAGDYALNAVETDPSGVPHNFPLTLHIVDFNLTAPAPSSITVNRPNNSVPVSFRVTAAGSFAAAVDLSCSGLPVGATCTFQPSSTIFPTSASPVPVTLTISTSTVTPSGAFPLTINGSTSGLNRTQNLSLTVTANADFTLVISSDQQSVTVRNTLGRGNTQRHAHGIQRLRQHGEPELWHGRAANLYIFASERHSNSGRSRLYRIRQQQPGAELQFRHRRPGHRFFGNPPFIQGDAQLNFRFQYYE